MKSENGQQDFYNELETVKKEYFDTQLNWYKTHNNTPQFLFRITGTLVIIISVSIPFLTIFQTENKNFFISIAALLLAALTNLMTFYQWDTAWKNNRQSELTMSHLESVWKIRILESKNMSNIDDAKTNAVTATQKLFDDTSELVSTGRSQYFEKVKVTQALEKK